MLKSLKCYALQYLFQHKLWFATFDLMPNSRGKPSRFPKGTKAPQSHLLLAILKVASELWWHTVISHLPDSLWGYPNWMDLSHVKVSLNTWKYDNSIQQYTVYNSSAARPSGTWVRQYVPLSGRKHTVRKPFFNHSSCFVLFWENLLQHVPRISKAFVCRTGKPSKKVGSNCNCLHGCTSLAGLPEIIKNHKRSINPTCPK